jgi:hypothetical protein
MDDELPVRVPIRRVIQWIAERNAGTNPDVGAQSYDLAAAELLEANHENRLPIYGQKDGMASGPLESVPPGDSTELRSSALADTPLKIILGERRYLDIVDGSIRSRSTVYWGRLIALREDVLKLWPKVPISEASRSAVEEKPTKLRAVTAWLKETYPERSPKKVNELMRELEQNAPHIGKVSKRLFEEAIKQAYG